MPHRLSLTYHDLVALRDGEHLLGLYWLRLFRRRSWVAVVTNVPGNPGPSSSNAIDEIAIHLRDALGVRLDRLRLFEVWPRGSPGAARTSVNEVALYPEAHWIRCSHAEIARVVGRSMPKLPDHSRLYAQVLALGGGNFEEQLRERFEPVRVRKLPAPHNPSSCALHDRFVTIAARTPNADRSWDDARVAGREFIRSLTPSDRAQCRYHAADWRRIADESVRIIQEVGPGEAAAYARAARRSHVPKIEREWLVGLFEDPVFVSERGFSNGQHRGCALRFSGAARAAVVTGYDRFGTMCTDWTYAGGG